MTSLYSIAPSTPERTIRSVFKTFDINDDELLSKNEFKVFLEEFDINDDEEQEAIMKAVFSNTGNSCINIDDFIQLIKDDKLGVLIQTETHILCLVNWYRAFNKSKINNDNNGISWQVFYYTCWSKIFQNEELISWYWQQFKTETKERETITIKEILTGVIKCLQNKATINYVCFDFVVANASHAVTSTTTTTTTAATNETKTNEAIASDAIANDNDDDDGDEKELKKKWIEENNNNIINKIDDTNDIDNNETNINNNSNNINATGTVKMKGEVTATTMESKASQIQLQWFDCNVNEFNELKDKSIFATTEDTNDGINDSIEEEMKSWANDGNIIINNINDKDGKSVGMIIKENKKGEERKELIIGLIYQDQEKAQKSAKQ